MDRWITDWEPSTRYPAYTRANAGEVMPDPGSPLAWTLYWEPGIAPGWWDAHFVMGTFTPDEIDAHDVIACFGGYLYLNLTLARVWAHRAPGLTPEAIDRVYFGDHPDVPPIVIEPWHESAEATERLGAWLGGVMTATDLPQLRDDRRLAEEVRSQRPDLAAATDTQLVERARSLVPVVRQLFCRHLEVTGAASVGPGALGAVAEALGDPTLALRLISGVGDVDSAAPSAALWELSRQVRAAPELVAAFDAGVDGLLVRLTSSDSQACHAFLQELHRFTARFGSRGPNEWDIRSHTWETKPALALALVDRMRLAGDDDAPAARGSRITADREAATAQVEEALAGDAELLAQFRAALASSHAYLAGRERTKTNVIKVLHEIRVAVHELGHRNGYQPETACMLLADELDAFVADPGEFRARLAVREQQYRELFDLEPPFIVNGSVPPIDSWPSRSASAAVATAAAGSVLTGVPGCPGEATGVARVILDPADPMALEPGDVLVAPATDPSWTPLFVPAAAVVVDTGAPASHAVIVSRELGIPCVVSVTGATRSIPDGARVTVDGDRGTVTVH